MRVVKKYSNRKLYDTVGKRYITIEALGLLVKSGEEIKVIDNETGRDLTVKILTLLLSREKPGNEISSSMLMQMIRNGPSTLFDYGKKYVSLWHNALFLSREELERIVNKLVMEKEISENEGKRLKNELAGYTAGIKKWIKENIDRRVKEAISMMNLATGDHVSDLAEKLNDLNKRISKLENRMANKHSSRRTGRIRSKKNKSLCSQN